MQNCKCVLLWFYMTSIAEIPEPFLSAARSGRHEMECDIRTQPIHDGSYWRRHCAPLPSVRMSACRNVTRSGCWVGRWIPCRWRRLSGRHTASVSVVDTARPDSDQVTAVPSRRRAGTTSSVVWNKTSVTQHNRRAPTSSILWERCFISGFDWFTDFVPHCPLWLQFVYPFGFPLQQYYYGPAPSVGGIKRCASDVCPSVCRMTRTPLYRSKGQRSSCRGGACWRPPAQLVKLQCSSMSAKFRWSVQQCTIVSPNDHFRGSSSLPARLVHVYARAGP